jgi:TP901 family phage tail tape measure protein
MADERVKIIDIQVRYQDAIEALAKFRASLAEAKKYQTELKKALKDGQITQEQYDSSMAASNVYIRNQSEQMRTLSKQVHNQIKATQEQEGSLKQLRAELSNATAKWDAMGRAERESAKGRALQDHINNITTELKTAEEATQRFYRNVGNYKSATQGLENIRVKIADIGKQMLGLIGMGSMMQFSKQVIETTRDFEDAMARIKAVTNAAPEQLAMMEAKARELGKTTIYHASEAANAMETLSRGGFTAAEATEAVGKTLQFAQANVIGLDEAADIMIRTMRGFKLPVSEEEMTRVNDVLSKVSASSATNVLEIAEAMKNAAPFGSTLGQSVEEVSASLGVLADVGVRGADAGTALRMVMFGLATETPKQQKVFKEFGIEINQQSMATEGLTKTLQRLKESGIMEAADSANKLAAVFGRRATPQVMALVGNIDRLDEKLVLLGGKVNTYGEQAEQLVEATGQPLNQINATLAQLEEAGLKGAAATEVVKSAYNGLSAQAEQQRAVFDALGVTINKQTLETDGLSGSLKKLKDAGILEAANSAQMLAQVFGSEAAPMVETLIENVDGLQQKFVDLNNADVAGTTERMFNDSISELTKSIKTLSSAWEDWIISLGQTSDSGVIDTVNALTDAVRFLGSHVSEVINFIITAIASISFAKLVNGARASFVSIRDSAISNAEAASSTVRTLNSQEHVLKKQIASQEKMLYKEVNGERVMNENLTANEILMLEAKLGANRRQLQQTQAQQEAALLNEKKLWHQAAALNTSTTWKSAMVAASTAVQGFVAASKTALKGFIFTAVIMLAFEAIQKLFSLIDTSSDSTFGKITSAVTGFVKKGLNFLIDAFNSVVNYIKDFVENSRIMQVWLVAIKTEMSIVGAVFKSVWSVFKAGLKEIWNAFKLVAGIVGAVGTAIEGLLTLNWTQMKRGIQQVAKTATDFWKNTTDNAKQAGAEIADNIVGAYNSTVDAIKNANQSKAFGGAGTGVNAAAAGASIGGAIGGGGKSPAEAVEEEASKEGDKPKTKYAEDAKNAKEDWDQAKAYYDQLIKDQNATTEDVLAARKNMADAQKAYEELTGNKQKKGGGKSGEDKADRDAKKAAELERKAFEDAEKAMLDLMKDTAAKRRAQLEFQYDDEIRKLKVRLATEKLLTEDAKEAIRRTILLKEQKKNEEMAKLDDEELKREIENRQKVIQSRLSIAQKGSEEELELKRRANQEKAQLDVLALKQEEDNRMADAQERLRIAQEQYGAESAMALAAQQDLEAVELEFEERRNNIREAARQKNLQLEEQYQQQLAAQRQQEFQNQITELEMQMIQQNDLRQGYIGDLAVEELAQEQMRLNVVSQGEMDVLEIRRQAAEDRYNSILQQGQLEGETEQQYNTRRLQAEKAVYDAKAAYRKAELTNEKAHLTAMRSLSNSFVSLSAAIGESNKDFANLSKIITLAQIAIDTGRALSGGIASAASLPYPANLAAIASTIATILTNVATAISTVKSAQFAEGGKVTGPGTGTSDSIPARLSAGEFVVTAKATKLFEPLLMAMNNIGAGVVPMMATNSYRDYNMPTNELTESFREAAENIHPVVSVVEITERQGQVEVIENLDTL